MKKTYLVLAIVVLILGSLSVWVIVDRLPDWMGTTRNQHRFIDHLEQQGSIDFEVTTIDGQTIKMSQFQGKLVILSFWASWCAPCVEEFPSMISLLQRFPDKIVMIALSSDYAREDIDIFFKSLNLPNTLNNLYIAWDPQHEVSKKYQVQRLPESFIFGKDQKLLRKVIGSIKWDDEDAVGFFTSHSN